jgi:hypothetical protein
MLTCRSHHHRGSGNLLCLDYLSFSFHLSGSERAARGERFVCFSWLEVQTPEHRDLAARELSKRRRIPTLTSSSSSSPKSILQLSLLPHAAPLSPPPIPRLQAGDGIDPAAAAGSRARRAAAAGSRDHRPRPRGRQVPPSPPAPPREVAARSVCARPPVILPSYHCKPAFTC